MKLERYNYTTSMGKEGDFDESGGSSSDVHLVGPGVDAQPPFLGGTGVDPQVPSYPSEGDDKSQTGGGLPLNLAIKALTRYRGNFPEVEEWVYAVDDLMNGVNPGERDLFFRVVRTYIVGEASAAIRGSDNDWQTTRTTLYQIYGRKTTLPEIERSLMEARQTIEESVDVFGARIRKLGVKYLALLQKTYGTSSVDRRMVWDRVRDYFVRGLSAQIYRAIINMTFKDLAEAQATASRIEREFEARADLQAIIDRSNPNEFDRMQNSRSGYQNYRKNKRKNQQTDFQAHFGEGQYTNKERDFYDRPQMPSYGQSGNSNFNNPKNNYANKGVRNLNNGYEENGKNFHRGSESLNLNFDHLEISGPSTRNFNSNGNRQNYQFENRNRDMRCYRCNEYGHIATYCNQRKTYLPPAPNPRVSSSEVRETGTQLPRQVCSFCGKNGHGRESCYALKNQLRRERDSEMNNNNSGNGESSGLRPESGAPSKR